MSNQRNIKDVIMSNQRNTKDVHPEEHQRCPNERNMKDVHTQKRERCTLRENLYERCPARGTSKMYTQTTVTDMQPQEHARCTEKRKSSTTRGI